MKNIFNISVLCLIMMSCGGNGSQQNESKTDSLENEVNRDTTRIKASLSEDTKSDSIVRREPWRNKYSLPLIESVEYLHASTSLENVFPKNGSYNDSLLIFLKRYKEKLPDMEKYQSYYVYVNCSSDTTAKCICNENPTLSFGLLILYDPASRHAKAINIDFSFYMDSSDHMNYTIDKNIILLEEGGEAEGSDEEGNSVAEEFEGPRHIIRISSDGSINITQNIQ